MASSSASVTPPAPYIHEALPPCHESGRSAVVIAPKPPIDVPAYLDAHDLFDQVTVIAVSVTDVRPPLKPLRPIAYSSQVPQPTSKPPKKQEPPLSATLERPTTPPTWSTPEQPRSYTAWASQRSACEARRIDPID